MVDRYSMDNALQEQAIGWLIRLNRDDLTADEEKAFFEWLNSSPLHQSAYINAEDLWQRGEVLSRVQARQVVQPSIWHWGLGFALTLLLGIGSWLIWFQGPEVQQFEYASAFGQQTKIELADGSRVLLNSDSVLSIRLERSARIAGLARGEAFFEVATDSDRPFIVTTPQGIVRVVGTRFAVRLLEQDSLVTVLEGKVALGTTSESSGFTAKQVLTANQQLSLGAAIAGGQPQRVEANNLLAWREHQLIFKGQPLGEVVRELQRYFPVSIQLSPELAQREITAVIQLSDQQTTLDQLALALGLSWETSGAHELRLIDVDIKNLQ